jgi:hypothetical protein
MFAKRGLRLLLIAKFVPGLDGICPPLAAMLGASRAAFLLHDAGGATLWAGAYLSCGIIFAKQLDQVAQHISAVALVVLIFGVPLVLLFAFKVTQLVIMIRLLQPLQILPETSSARLDSGAKVESLICFVSRKILKASPRFLEHCASIRLNSGAKRTSLCLRTSIWCSTADQETAL